MTDAAHDPLHDKMTAEHVELHLDEELLRQHQSEGHQLPLADPHLDNVKDLELGLVSILTKIS